ncbi:MAG: M15 family metallopeptidase, partial [Clostridia bacterium]|nr:M15 family metallopeptidase [Clostridia bacterium]
NSSSSETVTSDDGKDNTEDNPNVSASNNGLDSKYSNYMLVNGSHPLPDNYDSDIRQYLVEIDPQLRNNNYVTKIHKSVYPYITAMVKAAQADGVDLRVWSPFRSYADQKALFDKQVARAGGDENKAATVVARPGTSEHNTGICADFNMADDAFENTRMYKWMCEHAEDYGFILRYPKDKQDKTGVIYESWHWRFVGIEAAKKINKSGLCLEEYLEKNKIEQKITNGNF